MQLRVQSRHGARRERHGVHRAVAITSPPTPTEEVPVSAAKQPTVVLAATAIAFALVAGAFAYAWNGQRAAGDEQVVVKANATRFLHALTTFTPGSIDRAFSEVQGYATSAFAGQAGKFFNSSIRQQLEIAKAQSQGQVRDLFVQSMDPGSASLYAVVDQTYINDKVSKPVADVLRLVIDMKKVAGQWKVADLTVLQAPSAAAGP